MKRNIAIIDHIGNKGGHHYYCLSILDAFNKLGYGAFYYTNFFEANENVRVEKVYDRAIRKDFRGFFNIIGGTVRSIISCKRNNVRFVMFHLFEAGWLNFFILLMIKSARLKIISVVHDVSSFAAEDSAFAKKMVYEKLSDYLIVHNQYSYDELRKEVSDRVMNKVYVIKHGGYSQFIDNQIPKAEALEKLGLDPNFSYILFFGLIKKVKGLELLLKALKETNENVKLVIAGKPWQNDFAPYEALIQEYKLEDKIIKYIRFIDDDEKDYFFNMASAIVLPYKKIYQSGVLLMAMSYGIPIIASDLPATREVIVHGRNGLLFEAGNYEALSAEINKLTADEQLMEDLGENALITIETDYSWETIAGQYQPILSE